jgi:hypothetical protein
VLLTEALATMKRNEESNDEAEIHRLNGTLLLRHEQLNPPGAKRSFKRAIAIAQRRGGKSLGLLVMTSLARLLASQGHRVAARLRLAEVYNWSTEGFDSVDLIEAKALREELDL